MAGDFLESAPPIDLSKYLFFNWLDELAFAKFVILDELQLNYYF
jgi:hypothetical protein